MPLAAGAPLHVELSPREGGDLTPFLLLTAQATEVGRELERVTVVRAVLRGGPADRLADILARQIDTPDKFLRLLVLLLGLGSPSAVQPVDGAQLGVGSGGTWAPPGPAGILELLVRALAVDPNVIDRLDAIVGHLQQHDQARRRAPGRLRRFAVINATSAQVL